MRIDAASNSLSAWGFCPGLAAAITGDTNLAAIGVSASATSTVVNILSTSVNNTTYTQSVTGGATETITLAPAASVSQFAYNTVNQLTSIATGGATAFQALTNKTLKSATINSQPATLNWTESFSGNATLSSGVNNVPVSATDAASNVKTNSYQIGLAGPSSSSLTFDNNGNMTSDGTNSYAWDAENRLIQITYPGSGNNSKFVYDPFSGLVKIVETVASSVTSTKQFVRCGSNMCEERDASSAVTKRFFGWGQTIGATNYFYTRDHLGSVRDMTDGSGVVQAHLEYGMWGEPTKTAGAIDTDFGYAGYYAHARSGLNLTVYRAYNPTLGRWINRDPIAEDGGNNLYQYAGNRPTLMIDPTGLQQGIPLNTFASNIGISPSNLKSGCVDVVNGKLGLNSGSDPDKAPGVACWAGKDAQTNAQNHLSCCGSKGGAVWVKQGPWTNGDPGAGTVSPFSIGPGGNYNYVTLIPHGNTFTFVDMNHGANMSTPQLGNSYATFGEVPNPWASVPGGNAIWCSACHK